MLQTVAETAAYLASAKEEGMTDAERTLAVNTVAADPTAGEMIVGSGGCRKLRIAGRGKGKSGGYRIVTVYGGGELPIYLIAVLGKGSRANFSKAEVAAMAAAAKRLKDAHRPRAAG